MKSLSLFRRQIFLLIALIFVVSGLTIQAQSVVLTNFARLTNGSVRFEASGTGGLIYSLQMSSDLQNWRTLDFTNAAGGAATFQDNAAAATSSNRYYRVRLDPPNPIILVTNYHNWTNCILMRNGLVEVAIVPTVGRIMQMRFLTNSDGPFWENTSMNGQQPSATSWNNTGSFGGDKVWPSPQSWPWPPPRGFDSTNYTATVSNGVVIMSGPVDSAFGTRVVRRISLHPTEAILRVSSTFEKVSGTHNIGVWTITQTKGDAQRIFMVMPKNTIVPAGYQSIGGNSVPPGIVVSNRLVAFVRPPGISTKIGNDGGALLWVGTNQVLLIESPRVPGLAASSYPDSDSSVEVYTNGGGTSYIELEFLAPLMNLAPGSTAEAVTVYSLLPRTSADPFQEANKLLSR